MQIHTIPPVFDENSRILILGSFPSVKSREQGFFYGNPQNRFWRVLAAVFTSDVPKTIDGKKEFLLINKIALWDVIESCEIKGSSDLSIKNVTPNDLSAIFSKADIRAIFTNGKTAHGCYCKYIREKIGKDAVCLPSTSSANVAYGAERLADAWKVIKI